MISFGDWVTLEWKIKWRTQSLSRKQKAILREVNQFWTYPENKKKRNVVINGCGRATRLKQPLDNWKIAKCSASIAVMILKLIYSTFHVSFQKPLPWKAFPKTFVFTVLIEMLHVYFWKPSPWTAFWKTYVFTVTLTRYARPFLKNFTLESVSENLRFRCQTPPFSRIVLLWTENQNA